MLTKPAVSVFLLSCTKSLVAFLVPRISSSLPFIPSRKIGYGIRICRGWRSVVNFAKVINNGHRRAAAAAAAQRSAVVETSSHWKTKSNSQLEASCKSFEVLSEISVRSLACWFRRTSASVCPPVRPLPPD